MKTPRKASRGVTTLVPAFGSNRTNAARPAKLLEGCEWIGVVFAGGMSECAHFTSRTLLINDKHSQLINLANVLRTPELGPMLIRDLRRLPVHPYQLRHSQGQCIKIDARGLQDSPETEWAGGVYMAALNYFVTAWMGRSGLALTKKEFTGGLCLRWNAGGGDSAVRWRSAIDGLRAWRRILERATFSVLGYGEFLDRCEDNPKHGIYCDPPWPDDGDQYTHTFTEQDHRDLAARVSAFERTRVVMRFGDHPLVRELYPEPGWTWIPVAGRTQHNNAKSEVLLVRNGVI